MKNLIKDDYLQKVYKNFKQIILNIKNKSLYQKIKFIKITYIKNLIDNDILTHQCHTNANS